MVYDVEKETLDGLIRDSVWDAMCELSDVRFTILWLHFWEGRSFAEIAKMVNRSRARVYQIQYRALEDIKSILVDTL